MQSDVFLCITHANTVTRVFLDYFPTQKYFPLQLLSIKNTTTSWNKFTVTFSELGVLFSQLFIYLFILSLCKNEIERCPQLVTVFFCYLQENPVFWGFLGNRLLSHNTCVVEQLWVVALIFNNWQLYSFFSSESHYCKVVRQLIKSSIFLKKCCGIKLLAVVFAFNRYESEIGFLI